MSASQFVGRVGGLAAVLGAGAALSLGQGVAWADDTSQTGEPSVSSTPGSSPSGLPHSHRPAAGGSSAGSAPTRTKLRAALAPTDDPGRVSTALPANSAAPTKAPPDTPGPDQLPSQSPVETNVSSAPPADATLAPRTTTEASTIAFAGQPASGGDVAGGEVTSTVALDTAPTAFSPRVEPAAALIRTAHTNPAIPADSDAPTNTTPATPGGHRLPGAIAVTGKSASGHDVAGGEVTPMVALGTAPAAPSPRVEPVAALTPISGATPTAAAATRVAVTVKTIVTDMLTWIGLGWLEPSVPGPALPAPSVTESLWLAVRDVLGKSNSVRLIGRSFTLDGSETGQALTPDGTRAVITTDATNWDVGGFATKTAVVNTITGRQVGTTLTLNGIPTGSPLVSADGTRAVITARPQYNGADVMVIDTATGNQIGNTFTLAGQMALPTVLNADGTRAVVTTTSGDLISGGTRVAVIDTATGKQIGTTVTLPGDNSFVSNADGNQAVVATMDGDWDAGFTTRVTVIDTATGLQIGTPLILNGRLNDHAISAGLPAVDSHVLITTDDYDSADESITRLAVIDTTTGTQIGALTLAGSAAWTPLVLSADGSRALITATSGYPSTNQTRVAVIETATGQQIGTTLTFGDYASGAVVSSHGSHALITMSTQVAVIDTATGAGTTVTLPGGSPREPLLSTDGIHALIADNAGDAVIINTATGAQTALISALTGRPDAFDLVSADGTRAVITTTVPGAVDGLGTTRVAVIDTTTGAQIGSIFTLTGDATGLVTSADGKHALIITSVFKPRFPGLADLGIGSHSTRVAVIDATTGKQVGTTLAFVGAETLSRDGDRVLITTFTGINTQMAVIDITTGKKGRNTVTLAGEYGGEPLVNADGTRVVIPTYHRSAVGRTRIQVATLGRI